MISQGSLSSARMVRLSALAEFEAKLRQLASQEAHLRAELEAAIPASLREYFEEEGCLGYLFQYGRYSSKIRYDGGQYGFNTEREIRDAFKSLVSAWKKAVFVTYSDDSGRVEVTLKVLP